MSYNCLFTVLTDENLVDHTLTHAAAIAEAYDAHLDVLCLGVDSTQTGYYYAGAGAILLQESLAQAEAEAKAIEARATAILDRSGSRWGSESGVVQLGNANRQVAARARYSDLVILPRPYGEGRGAELEAVTEATLFDGRTPTMILPETGKPATRPRRIMIAWNEGAEALNAVRAALPLLREADAVHVVVVDPPVLGDHQGDPGVALSQYLARHGVTVDVDILAKTQSQICDVLTRHATDMDADMLVMGAYGHSRFREAIFGGATRDMLEQANLPVLMSH